MSARPRVDTAQARHVLVTRGGGGGGVEVGSAFALRRLCLEDDLGSGSLVQIHHRGVLVVTDARRYRETRAPARSYW